MKLLSNSIAIAAMGMAGQSLAQQDQVIVADDDVGGVYEGTFENGLRHGTGTYRLPDGFEYTGEWVEGEIQGKGIQSTVIGVLGGTGVGKSSLLNALLGEADILPTSGSRGCTAAPVELRYNAQLSAAPAADGADDVKIGECPSLAHAAARRGR